MAQQKVVDMKKARHTAISEADRGQMRESMNHVFHCAFFFGDSDRPSKADWIHLWVLLLQNDPQYGYQLSNNSQVAQAEDQKIIQSGSYRFEQYRRQCQGVFAGAAQWILSY